MSCRAAKNQLPSKDHYLHDHLEPVDGRRERPADGAGQAARHEQLERLVPVCLSRAAACRREGAVVLVVQPLLLRCGPLRAGGRRARLEAAWPGARLAAVSLSEVLLDRAVRVLLLRVLLSGPLETRAGERASPAAITGRVRRARE